MSNKVAILVDRDKCIGCQTCVVACNLMSAASDVEKIRVNTIGPEKIDGKLQMSFFPEMTESCSLRDEQMHPPCVSACNVGALVCCNMGKALSLLHSDGRYQVTKVT